MSAQRLRISSSLKRQAVEAVLQARKPVSAVSREFGVARKTIYKWIKRYQSSPARLKAASLEPRYVSGDRHPRIAAEAARLVLVRLAVAHPEWGCRKFSYELKKRGISVGYFGVFKLLRSLGVSTPALRRVFAKQWSGPGRLTPEIKLSIVREAIDENVPISELSKRHGVARKTIYKWIEKYKRASEIGLISSEAFRERYARAAAHPRAIYPLIEEKLLSLVASQPRLSVHRLASFVPASSFTVWKVLRSHNLASVSLREAYARFLRRQAEEILDVRPELSWLGRLKQVFEQFVPTRAPAGPPPGLRPSGPAAPGLVPALSSLFRSSPFLLLVFLILFGSFEWGRLIGSAASLYQAMGWVFASIALMMGSVFFLYSLKYYFTLAVVLSFSREAGEGVVQSQKSKVKSPQFPIGWLGRVFGIGMMRGEGLGSRVEGGGRMAESEEQRGPAFVQDSGEAKEGGLTRSNLVNQGGLTPDVSQVKLERYPMISVHLPVYNEPKVVERLLKACTSFDYPNYEVVVADDSTDETTGIVERFLKGYQGEAREIKGDQGEEILHVTPSTPDTPSFTLIHRADREGFKGGALREALKATDPRAEFIVVFDADFVPYPDTLELFLKYFQVSAGGLDAAKGYQGKSRTIKGNHGNTSPDISSSPLILPDDPCRIAAIQGYQWPRKDFSDSSASPSEPGNQRGKHVSGYQDSNIAAIQGYQWHVLNKSENWITRGVRSEYAGSYVIERSGAELYGGLKQIAGSVYMIRRDLLETFQWGTSLTEDFELTLKLYEAGYRVLYTPYIQAPSECVSTLKRLIRQRMRWAEGHSFNIRRMFGRLLFGGWSEAAGEYGGMNHELGIMNYGFGMRNLKDSSHDSSFHANRQAGMIHDSKASQRQGTVWLPSPLSFSEKLEFLYLSPYYLQAAFFLLGTFSWLVSETWLNARLPFWTTVWGWSLVLTNLLSLPLMNLVGLFLEEAEERDFVGIFSFVLLSYLLVPFQAYASVKGFLETQEGPWFRTPKTGRITDVLTRGRFYRFLRGIFPGRLQSAAEDLATWVPASLASLGGPASPNRGEWPPGIPSLYPLPYTLNPIRAFSGFTIRRRQTRTVGRFFLTLMLLTSTILSSLAPGIPVRQMEGGLGTGVLVSPAKDESRSMNDELWRIPELVRQVYAADDSTSEVTRQRVGNLELTGEKTDFAATEAPSFTIRDHPTIVTRYLSFIGRLFGRMNPPFSERVQVQVVDSIGEAVEGVTIAEDGEGGVALVLDDPSLALRPGKYTLTVRDGSRTIEQDFTWGVLAVNTNKSVYTKGETAKLSMAVLDEQGEMVCDADLKLQITNDKSQTTINVQNSNTQTILSTRDGSITVNPSCDNHLYTLTPDYEAEYQVGEAGTYQMTLTAETEQGTFSIRDAFAVKESVAFEIERTSGTRIFPPATYPMTLTVKANQDFEGEVVEAVPDTFEVNLKTQNAKGKTTTKNAKLGEKQIIWQVEWKKGETYTLEYEFRAPPESPAFYMIGPIKLKVKSEKLKVAEGEILFSEARRWQLAIDALGVGNTSSATAWSSDVTGVSWSHSIGSGVNQLLVVAIGIKEPTDNDRDVTSVTFDGTAMAEATGAMADDSTANDNMRSEIWYLAIGSKAAASYTIQANFAGNVVSGDAHAIAFTNAAQSGQPDATNTAAGSGTPSGAVVTGTDDAYVVDMLTYDLATTSITKDASQTLISSSVAEPANGASYEYKATAGSVTMSWAETGSAVDWVLGMASFEGTAKVTLEGTTYSDEGGGNLGINKTVNLRINGAGTLTDETDASGVWSIANVDVEPGDILTAYLDNEGTDEATTVLISDGLAKSDIHLYVGTVAVRVDSGTSITPDNLYTGDDTDDDVKYIVSAASNGNLTVDSGFELHVWTGDTFDASGGTVTTQGSNGIVHVDDSATATLDTATNAISDDILVDASATLNLNASTTMSGADGTANVTVAGDTQATAGTLTFNESGTISGAGSDIDFWDISVGTTGKTLTVNPTTGINVDGGDLTSTGTASITYTSGTPNVTMTGAGTLGGGSGTHKFYNLTMNGASNTTTLSTNNTTIENGLTIGISHTFAMGTNSITVGSTAISDSGDISIGSAGLTSQSASGTLTILSTSNAADWTGPGTLVAYNLTIGNGSAMTVDNETSDLSVILTNDFTISTNAVFQASSSSSFYIGNAYANSGTFTANQGRVVMDAGDASGNTLSGTMTGTSSFYKLRFNNASGSWSFSADATVSNEFHILNAATNGVTAPSGTLSVGGDFIHDDTGSFVHNSGTVSLTGTADTTQTITGATNFYSLSATTGDRIIKFGSSTTFSVAASATLTLTGTDCTNLLVIRSTTPGTQFTLTDNAGGTTSVSSIDLQDAGNPTTGITASASVDSGNNHASWSIAASACIGAGENAIASGYSFQRKTFFDDQDAKNTYWLFYHDGDQIEVRYSQDNGATWDDYRDIASFNYDTNDFSVWYRSIGGTEYVWVAIAVNDDIIVRRGTLSATSISWHGTTQTALNGGGASDTYANAYLSLDSSNYLWVMARYYNGGGYSVKAVDSIATAGSDWAALTWNSAKQISDGTSNTTVYGTVVPLASQDMYATFVSNTALEGCLWDDDDSGGRWEDGSGNACAYGALTTSYYFKNQNADYLATDTNNGTREMNTTLGASTASQTLDGAGDTFYILTDNRNKQWTADKTFTTSTTGEKRNIDIATDSSGNTVAVWEDTRNSNSVNDSFVSTGDLIGRRQYHTATLLNNGKVLAAGGYDGATLSTAEVYDPATGTFASTGNLVGRRYSHTATLLNNGKVLAAGGFGNDYLSTAEVYDPATGTFASTGNLIGRRYLHTATLLSNGKVLAAGGYDGAYLSTAELYDPATGTFASTGNLIGRRQLHTATLLSNGKVLAAGGYDGAALSTAEVYDPASGTFASTGNLIGRRQQHTATLLSNGKVLAAGGSDGASLSTAELYDPAAGTFASTGNLIGRRYLHTATLLSNGKVLAAGGFGSDYLSTAELYDPSAGTWSSTGNLIGRRFRHTASLLANGKVLAAGGSDTTSLSTAEVYTPRTSDVYAQKYDKDGTAQWGGGTADIKVNSDSGNRETTGDKASNYDHLNPKVKLDSTGNAIVVWQESRNSVYGDDIYSQKLQSSDGAKLWPAASSSTDKFTSTGNMIGRRTKHTATLLNNGKVLAAGGTPDGTAALSTAELYDPSSGTFTSTGNLIGRRGYHTATLLNNGRVLAAGGYNGAYLSTAEVYDPATGTFASTGNLIGMRQEHTTTLLANGKVLVAGGDNGTYLSTAELYDPATGTFASTGNLIGRRFYHTATLLANGKVLVAGGISTGDAVLSTAEVYDPETGTFASTGNLIGGRQEYSATLLNNGKVLVAGGTSGAVLSTSEVYDPATGTFASTGNLISLRYNHTSTLLGNGKVLVAGGDTVGGAGGELSTAELYDPSTGTWSSAGNLVGRRYLHTATLLGNGKVLVAVGSDGTNSISTAEVYTPSMDIAVSNDGSPMNGSGLPVPEYPGRKGILGEQRKPVLAIDSSNNVIVAWEDDRDSAIRNWGLSWNYDSNAWWQTNVNLAAAGACNGGGGTNNSCGALPAITGPPLRIMGQKLSSSDGAKNWGDDQAGINQNNPEDIGLTSTGDGNRNPSLAIDGTNVILTWDSNSASKAESGTLKREGNIYAQKLNGSTGSPLWGQTFASTGNLIGRRYWHTATLLSNGKVLAAGGYGAANLSTAEVYDPAAGTWAATGNLIGMRRQHTATLLSNGKVLAAGGDDGASLSTAELYDPAAGTFSSTGNLIGRRYEHTAALLPNGKVLVSGGTTNGTTALSTAEVYDLVTGTFTSTGNLIGRRFGYTAALLPNGKVLVSGGTSNGTTYLSTAELYDPATGTFASTGNLIGGRFDYTATLLPNGKVLVAAGDTASGVGGELSTAEVYDPATGTFTSTGNLIGMRYSHTGTLLSNGKVLAAGGLGIAVLSTAELYDPTTGTFTSTDNIIGRRRFHTATILANGSILAAAGDNGSNSLSTAELYSIDQMVNSGVDLAEQGEPDAVVSGSSIFFSWAGRRGSGAGGGPTSGDSDRGGGSYKIFGMKTDNPTSGGLTQQWPSGSTGVFSSTGNLVGRREWYTTTLLFNGKVLAAGGFDGASLSTAELYDPATGTFASTGNLIGRRYFHTATLLGNGKVLAAGGFLGGTTYLSTAELYDPATGTFASTGNLIGSRYGHTATLLGNGKVLTAGGFDGAFLSTAELYDPATGTFASTGNLIGRHSNHTATLLPNGRVLVAGGYAGAYLSTAELYDPATGTFSSTGNLIGMRQDYTATLLGNGKVLAAGGFAGAYLSTAELYDPATGTWSSTGNLIGMRSEHTATLLGNGKVLVAAGRSATTTNLSTAELYDPSTGTFASTGNLIGLRRSHTATLLGNGKVLTAGGYNGTIYLNTAELYNPAGEMMLSHDFGLAGNQRYPRIAVDSGNPYVVWEDDRSFVGNTVTSDKNVFMQKFDGTTGAPLWPAASTGGGYTSPYTVMDIRADTLTGGTGTHYSGRPSLGGITGILGDLTKRIVIGFEDNRNDTGAAAGECGVSNTSSLVRVCGQSLNINEVNVPQTTSWVVKFKANQAATLTVNTDITEWDGTQVAKASASQTWGPTCDGGDCTVLQTVTFTTGGANGPPSDTVGNMTMRRHRARLTWSAGSVIISYDNTGVNASRLETGALGSQDPIDTVNANLSDTISAVSDASGLVHLIFIDDAGTDQVSYKRRTGTTWGSVTLVPDAADDNDSYPSLSLDTDAGALYAIWTEEAGSGTDLVRYSSCTIGSGCDDPSEWAGELTVSGAENDDFSYTSSNYSGASHIFGMWTVGGTSPFHVDWAYIVIPERLWLLFGAAPLIPLMLRRRRRAYSPSTPLRTSV